MEMDRQIEILEKVVSILRDKTNGIVCICDALQMQHTRFEPTHEDYITRSEWDIMDEFIFRHKPSPTNQFKEFTDTPHWINDIFWWTDIDSAEETRHTRINFVNSLILMLKSKWSYDNIFK